MLTAYKIDKDGFFAGAIEVAPTDPLPRSCTFTAPPEGKTVRWEHGKWVEGVKTNSVVSYIDADLLAKDIRTERNKLLSESDWTQVADAPVDKEAWAIYRQALRDISDQEYFPLAVMWPVTPQG